MRILDIELGKFSLSIWEFPPELGVTIKFKVENMADKPEYLKLTMIKNNKTKPWKQVLVRIMTESNQKENNVLTDGAIKSRKVISGLKEMGIL